MVDTSVQYLTTTQVASMLQVSPRCVLDEIHRHRLPAVRFGRSMRIHPEALEKYLSKNDTRRG